MTLTRWLSWLLGGAFLAAVIVAALHFSEGRAFVQLAERAEPWWLLAAVLLQTVTYIAQGGIWRHVGRAAGCVLSRKTAFQLSLAKLFADQALPSAGLSSSILVAKALEQRDVPPGAVRAAVVVNIASYISRTSPPLGRPASSQHVRTPTRSSSPRPSCSCSSRSD